MMKKRWIGIFVIAILINSLLFWQIGFDNGISSTTNDEYYKQIINDVFPDDEQEFTYIILEDEKYFVYHNTDGELYNTILNNGSIRVYLFPEITFQRFNDIPIFHRGVIPIALYPFSDSDEYIWVNYILNESTGEGYTLSGEP